MLNGDTDYRARCKQAGEWLRKTREKAGLTQRDVAKAVGLGNPSVVSQIELGLIRLPPARWDAYAAALGVSARDLGREMTRHYNPAQYRSLFGDDVQLVAS